MAVVTSLTHQRSFTNCTIEVLEMLSKIAVSALLTGILNTMSNANMPGILVEN